VYSAENVYVADTDSHRIQKFNSSNGFLVQWGSYGSADGQFNFYLDGVYKNDVLKGVNYYNAIVAPGTYTIGTRTVDTEGNINATMETHTATTILPSIRFINGTVMDSVSKAVIPGVTVSTSSYSTTSNAPL
jgi:hypothetical protein